MPNCRKKWNSPSDSTSRRSKSLSPPQPPSPGTKAGNPKTDNHGATYSPASQKNVSTPSSRKGSSQTSMPASTSSPSTPPSHFISHIRNFTFEPKERSSVNKLIHATLRDSSVVKNLTDSILATHNNLVPKLALQQGYTLDWLVSSTRAFHIQSEKQPGKVYCHWNWYIQTPTTNQTQVDKWTTKLAKLSFDSKQQGVGFTISNLSCTCCKSTNNVKSKCPFTDRPFVPTASNERPTRPANGGRGGKRGNSRGNGRGRN